MARVGLGGLGQPCESAILLLREPDTYEQAAAEWNPVYRTPV